MSDLGIMTAVRAFLVGGPPVKTLPPTVFRHTSVAVVGGVSIRLDEPHVFCSSVSEWSSICRERFQKVGGDGFVLCFVADDSVDSEESQGEYPEGVDSDFIIISVHREGDYLRSFKTPIKDFMDGMVGEEVDLREFIPDLGFDSH